MEKTKRVLSSGRDATFWKVLNAALELDFRKGHLKWTMSELSRKSGITRSLIYYHFGRSKIAILDEAVRVIGEEIAGIGSERMKMWKAGDWAGSIRATRAVSTQSPYLCNFYLLHRERPTEIGAALRDIESAYLKKLKVIFPELPEPGIRALFALFFGTAFAPLVNDQAVEYAIAALKTLVGLNETSFADQA